MLALKCRGPHVRLLGGKAWLKGNRKRGLSLTTKKLNPANTLTEQGNRFFTRVSSKECSPISTLIFAGCQSSNLANYEIINGYCFKALTLWLFAIAAIAN